MEPILEALAQYGIAGIFLAVLVYYLNKLTDIHRQERAEWSENSYCNPVLDGLGSVSSAEIRDLILPSILSVITAP